MASKKTKDFRRIYANALGVGMSDHDVFITFGVSEPSKPISEPSKPKGDMIEEVMVFLTPRTAQMLSHALAGFLGQWEEQNGKIELPAGKSSADVAAEISGLFSKKTNKPS